MTKVAVCQSNYLPWRGYFDLMRRADVFVFYDDVQYTKNDWRNRNRFRGPNGSYWLTIPVGSQHACQIDEVVIRDERWQSHHHSSIRHSYANATQYSHVAPFLDALYLQRKWNNLSELNRWATVTIAKQYLQIQTECFVSSQWSLVGKKGDRLLNLLSAIGATEYISGPSAATYIDAEQFDRAGVRLTYLDYDHYPRYPQIGDSFDGAVSILDLLCNTGPAAASFIWSEG